MIKVFLVENEAEVREEIKNSIQWEREGYELVGEAGDGELAYPMILESMPDILITDIEMPFMDGLELGRLVRKELPDTKIVIVSASAEFKYARDAIKIGVEEYLLKPVSSAELLEVLRVVSASIFREREGRELIRRFEENIWENREYKKEEFLIRILTQNLSVTDILEQAKQLEMDLSARLYNTVLLKIAGDFGDGGGQFAELSREIESMLQEQKGLYYFRRGIEGWALLFLAEDQHQMDEKIEMTGEGISRIVQEFPQTVEYFGATGKPVMRIRELRESVGEAERVFAFRYLKRWNQIINSDDISADASENIELTLSSIEIGRMDRQFVEEFMRTGLKGDVARFVDEYCRGTGEGNMQSVLFRQYMAMDVYLVAASVLESLGYDTGELVARCGDFKDMVRVFQTADRTKKYLRDVIGTTVEMRENVSKYANSLLLKAARSYIEKNYDNEEISLNTVAASVNLSPNYFSTIFSQGMGQTFIEYLTYVRMKKAKELLRSSNMKTSEIAYAVGYKDAHYFSYLFKKTQKCTPRDFKTQR